MTKNTPEWTTKLRNLWRDALLSGEYPQGFSLLRTHDGCYCCLGVLGRVCGIDPENPIFRGSFCVDISDVHRAALEFEDFAKLGELKASEKQIIDASSKLPKIPKVVEAYLTGLNDELKLPLAKIATIVSKIPIAVLNGKKPFVETAFPYGDKRKANE